MPLPFFFFFFFFNDTATTEIYTLSLHDALPIFQRPAAVHRQGWQFANGLSRTAPAHYRPDRKSTRLNSSHLVISYAVFCLKKKKNITQASQPSTKIYTTSYHQAIDLLPPLV